MRDRSSKSLLEIFLVLAGIVLELDPTTLMRRFKEDITFFIGRTVRDPPENHLSRRVSTLSDKAEVLVDVELLGRVIFIEVKEVNRPILVLLRVVLKRLGLRNVDN